MRGSPEAVDVVRQLLKHVLERGWRGYALAHRKAQPVGLPRAVVGVLAQDDHLRVANGEVLITTRDGAQAVGKLPGAVNQ